MVFKVLHYYRSNLYYDTITVSSIILTSITEPSFILPSLYCNSYFYQWTPTRTSLTISVNTNNLPRNYCSYLTVDCQSQFTLAQKIQESIPKAVSSGSSTIVMQMWTHPSVMNIWTQLIRRLFMNTCTRIKTLCERIWKLSHPDTQWKNCFTQDDSWVEPHEAFPRHDNRNWKCLPNNPTPEHMERHRMKVMFGNLTLL